ncbi:MAG: glycosyltransferase [Candidatus Neomarinimicrobiota bacterium]|nr:glycosyltransferase [Candidatus Neomarinimicrobiota bacterium]
MLSIIIVSYNVRSFLKQCLKSVYQSNISIPYEVIVVDNYSFDQSCRMIENDFKQVKLFRNKSNLGFSKAVNIGVNKSNGKYICLLNPDTVVKNNSLNELCKYIKNNSDIGVVGAKIINPDGTTQLASKRSFPSLWVGISKFFGLNSLFPNSKIFGKYNRTYSDEDKILNVDAVSGSCMVFSRNVFDKLNGFDESFFLYFEDTDFCTRAKDAGFKIIYNPTSKVIHFKGESHKNAPIDIIKIFHNSMSIYFNKHKNKFKLWPLSWFLIKIGIFAHLIKSYINHNKIIIKSYLLDIFIIIFSFVSSILFWYSIKYDFEINVFLVLKHWPLVLCFTIIWIVTASAFRLYTSNTASYGRAFASSLITLFITSFFVYYIKHIAYSRAVLMISSFISCLMIPSWRIFSVLWYKNKNSSFFSFIPHFTRNIAILGTNHESSQAGKIILNSPSINYNLAGFIKRDDNIANYISNEEILGRYDDLLNVIKKYKLNEIVIPESIYSGELLFKLIKLSNKANITFKYISTDDNLLVGKGIVEEIGQMKLIDLNIPLFDRFNLGLKRVFDILLSVFLIITTAPMQLVLFIFHRRIKTKIIWNSNNSHLKLYYFNSKFSIIRNLLLLYPVLYGKMTFVGCQQVKADLNNPELLYKPGLTGFGQIKSPNSNRNLKIFDEYYSKNHSIIFDLEIILKTVFKL